MNLSPLSGLPWGLWLLVLALLLLWPGWAAQGRRAWAVLLLAVLVMCLGLWQGLLAGLGPWEGSSRLRSPPWAAGLLTLAATLGVAVLLRQRLQLHWHEMGLGLRQRPGSLRPALAVSGVALLLHAASLDWSVRVQPPLPLQAWVHQATVPGLLEEVLFRGVALALADRAWTRRWQGAGVRLGWGGLALSLLFVALHGPSTSAMAGVAPAALLYLWLRLRTGSLLLPVLVHNLWNLLVLAAAR